MQNPDLSAVQSDSIAERADNIEIFSSVRKAHHEEMRQRWGFAKVSACFLPIYSSVCGTIACGCGRLVW
ncbi:hypothetical protein HMPREF0476_1890 [Kingella kingae ATCC 23330]|uniref:Uncharacterized protein n=1 Tax=Kingella kingae ATCC 23330 TaxID=887327 RepID=F5S9K7_KINKI|nr:hypothetical protein HMPREF0476_1890 [Kingella kingae ATCC 23330]